MKFLYRDTTDGQKPLILNMDQCVDIQQCGTGCSIAMTNGNIHYMQESVEYFRDKLEELNQ
jgi:hypothetical protein